MSTEARELTLVENAIEVQATHPIELLGSDPTMRLAEAQRIASLLAPIIRDRGLSSKIQGKEYVRFEGWTLLGSLLGVFPVTEWVHPIEGGYEARVAARTLGGQTVGTAHAICTRSERSWSTREDFALMSMAQTRAGGKTLRMPLGFVMQLAGYEATPAEEMSQEGEPVTVYPKKTGGQFPKAPAGPLATEKQVKMIWGKAKERGEKLRFTDAEVENRMRKIITDLGVSSSKHLSSTAGVDTVLAAIAAWSLEEPQDEPGAF